MFNRNKLSAALLVGMSSVFTIGTAAAQTVTYDVAAVKAAVDAAATPIATLGGATLVVLIGIKVWKWLRRAT